MSHIVTKILHSKRGVTIFFAMIIIGLLLGIGASISLLSQKQLSLATLGKQSELAFYAADSGIECVLYWDQNGNPNPFDPNNTNDQLISCNNQNITVIAGAGRTLPQINFGNACAVVTVSKDLNNGVTETTIDSQGYNDCTGISGQKLERKIELKY